MTVLRSRSAKITSKIWDLSYSVQNKEEPPKCDHCQCILTVRHILVDCAHLQPVRDNIFGSTSVVESFRFHPQFIIKFLKEIGLYYKF